MKSVFSVGTQNIGLKVVLKSTTLRLSDSGEELEKGKGPQHSNKR